MVLWRWLYCCISDWCPARSILVGNVWQSIPTPPCHSIPNSPQLARTRLCREWIFFHSHRCTCHFQVSDIRTHPRRSFGMTHYPNQSSKSNLSTSYILCCRKCKPRRSLLNRPSRSMQHHARWASLRQSREILASLCDRESLLASAAGKSSKEGVERGGEK